MSNFNYIYYIELFLKTRKFYLLTQCNLAGAFKEQWHDNDCSYDIREIRHHDHSRSW